MEEPLKEKWPKPEADADEQSSTMILLLTEELNLLLEKKDAQRHR